MDVGDIVNAPLPDGRGFYGLTPMACIPKPIMDFLYFNGKDFTNRPIRFNLIPLISKSRSKQLLSLFCFYQLALARIVGSVYYEFEKIKEKFKSREK